MSAPEKSTAERPAMMPVAELLEMAAPYNPRKISESELGLLRQSLREFGLVQPVIVNAQTGNIVGGHQRVLAAQMELIPEMQVMWVHLDPTREKQLNLALNKISGEWDDEKLRDVLLALDEEGAGLDVTGFTDIDLEKLLGTLVKDPAEEWQGMPEFESEDVSGFRHIMVHFRDQEAVDDFVSKLGVTLTEGVRFLSYPAEAHDSTKDIAFVSDAD
jgi:ParB-like chromosome segregation protein Spo0J